MSTTIGAWLREQWTFETADARARSLPDEKRKLLARTLERSQEHRAAAETLFARGSRARGLDEAKRAYDLLATIALDGEAANARDAARGKVAVDVPEELPVVDRDVSEAHADLFVALGEAQSEMEDAVAPFAESPKTIETTRKNQRLLIVTLLAITVASGAWFVLKNRWRASASASIPNHEPYRAMDQNVEAPWLLPPGTTGWLDLTPSRPSRVAKIKLCPPLGTTGAKRLAIAVYRKQDVVKSFEVELDHDGGIYPAWHSFDIGEANVDRIRLSVVSWIGSGGGIGEVQVLD